MKDVYKIIIDYLKENGYDGLCGDDCGCGVDELAPCDEDYSHCKPAYLHKNPDCEKCETKCDSYDGDAIAECYRTEKPDLFKSMGLPEVKFPETNSEMEF